MIFKLGEYDMITDKHIDRKILEIAYNLTNLTSYAELLQNIINESLDITNSDAGTLYILNNNKLSFMIMITRSKGICVGGDGLPVNLPPVELDSNSVCAYVAREHRTMNIPDVYNDSAFDWQGPKKYDALNDYHTTSQLVVPLINHEQKVIGVLQLINAQDLDGRVVAYSDYEQYIMEAIASLAAVSLSNYSMVNQLQELLDSFVVSFTTAIDARTPYNANHTRHVAEYCRRFCDFLAARYAGTGDDLDLTPNRKDQLIMAASLHDVGKLIVPLRIMNKSDRLADRLDEMELRWKWLRADLKTRLCLNMISQEEYDATISRFDEDIEFIRKCNTVGFLDNAALERIKSLADFKLVTSEGECVDFVTDEEIHELSIVKGTLTAEERRIIESHAVYTTQILDKIAFGEKYDKVRFYAGAHHEYLNGTGYPDGIMAQDIPAEVRIITIMDVFDSLTSSDRPYKKQMDQDRALSILHAMVDEGKLDGRIVDLTDEFLRSGDILSDISNMV